ncbi:MAG: hypothetical protein JXR84_12215 [Anaerolineae bacterium]|nr:hypothetical protein [Anaerolineae bacterium]
MPQSPDDMRSIVEQHNQTDPKHDFDGAAFSLGWEDGAAYTIHRSLYSLFIALEKTAARPGTH